jgi:hypothetical protein
MTSSVEQAAPASARARGRVPDFFIVGHAKSGTTALYEMLRRHPEIYMPDAKEPWFLASDMRPRFRSPMGGDEPETMEQYLALFAAAAPGQKAGEASSSYLWSRTAAQEIAAVQPDARIVAILREPASFLHSLHTQLLQTHVESERSLRRALELEPERRAGRHIPRRSHRPQLLMYSDHVRYAEQLRRYHEAFDPEQVLVLVYEEFRSDNEGTVRRVLRHLGVDERRQVEVLQANPSVRMRSQQLDEAVHALSVGRGPVSRAAKGVVKALTPARVRRGALRATQRHVVHAPTQPPDERLMAELRARFAPEVRAAGEYLGRDLAGVWGYERLG